MNTKLTLLLATFVAIITAAAIAVTRRPVLFSVTSPGELQRPGVTVFNPFRDKAPEVVAEAFLLELSRGNLSVLNSIPSPAGTESEIREKERAYRLRKWKLLDRTDAGDQVTLYYRTARVTAQYLDSPVVIVVDHQKGRWVMGKFSPAY
jgi:hypothetical protein